MDTAEIMKRAAEKAFATINHGADFSVLDSPDFIVPEQLDLPVPVLDPVRTATTPLSPLASADTPAAPTGVHQPASTLSTSSTPPIPAPPSTVQDTRVPFEVWEALAYDMALGTVADEILAERLKVDVEDLGVLRTNPYFVKLLSSKADEIKQLDENAPFTVAFRMIANRASSHFLSRLTNPSTSDKDFHSLFKTAVELARLTPPEDQPAAAATAQVTFNIQGIPGLDHLSTVQGVTIDHAPHQTPPGEAPDTIPLATTDLAPPTPSGTATTPTPTPTITLAEL